MHQDTEKTVWGRMRKSIIYNEKRCYLCGSTLNLERHHCIHGTAGRKLADKYGLWVWLCPFHHRDNRHGVHGDASLDLWFKQLAQNVFEIAYSHEMWMQIFGKNYL